MSNDLKSNGEHAGGANNDFPKLAPGDNADKVLSASYQNKLIAGIERSNRMTYGGGVIDFGPVSLQKGQRRAPESGNRIRVRLDYPYRAPMGAVVGVDFPILEETIEDQYDLVNFLNDPFTTYSCSKNQYRHHNRFAILEQELLPGQTGWAVISGVAKTFWHAQRPPYASDDSSPEDTAVNLPPESTNSAVDEYKQLAILAADYAIAMGDSEWGQEGSEHHYVEAGDLFIWNNRVRPWWLAPYPRRITADASQEYEILYPYRESGNAVASNRGRVMGFSGYIVPTPSCTGTSTATCKGARWSITASTCSAGCSSWPVIENPYSASSFGLDLPCVEDEAVSDLPCVSEYPFLDYVGSGVDDEVTAAAGAWADNGNLGNGAVYNWVVGNAILGTPESPGVLDQVTADESGRGTYWMPREFPDPYGSVSVDAYGIVLRACADLTCTYRCDGATWQRIRGETPYNLNEHWRCKCPDDWMELMADHDLPCTATSQPREFTVGMVFDSLNTTTTTTTSTTTTTTAAIGACCYTLTSPGFGADCLDGITQAACDSLSGTWSMGASCSSISSTCHIGACCRAISPGSSCSEETEYDCQRNSTGDYQFMGVGTVCSGVSCDGGGCCDESSGACSYTFEATCISLGRTYLGDGVSCAGCSASTTTTSSTTTTTSATSTTTTTTTTSSTTTTTEPIGACCDFVGFCVGGVTELHCTTIYSGTYQGDGTTCIPNPCN